MTVKFMAALVGVSEKSRVRCDVDVARVGVGMVEPKKAVVVPVGLMKGSVKR